MDFEEITKDWNESGLLVIPGFLDPLEIAELKRICDHVLQQAIAEAPDRANASNIAYLTERRYFHSQEADYLRLQNLSRIENRFAVDPFVRQASAVS
jgi:hypothetical protein